MDQDKLESIHSAETLPVARSCFHVLVVDS